MNTSTISPVAMDELSANIVPRLLESPADAVSCLERLSPGAAILELDFADGPNFVEIIARLQKQDARLSSSATLHIRGRAATDIVAGQSAADRL